MFPIEEVESRLRQAFPDAEVEVVDLTGTRDHYQARVVSAAFEGRTPLERHRLVFDVLDDAMRGPIHALVLKTSTPAETPARSDASAPDSLVPGDPSRESASELRSAQGSRSAAARGREPHGGGQ